MATECEHTDRPHYSSGKCQSCYLAEYYIKRKKHTRVGGKRVKKEDESCIGETVVKEQSIELKRNIGADSSDNKN